MKKIDVLCNKLEFDQMKYVRQNQLLSQSLQNYARIIMSSGGGALFALPVPVHFFICNSGRIFLFFLGLYSLLLLDV